MLPSIVLHLLHVLEGDELEIASGGGEDLNRMAHSSMVTTSQTLSMHACKASPQHLERKGASSKRCNLQVLMQQNCLLFIVYCLLCSRA